MVTARRASSGGGYDIAPLSGPALSSAPLSAGDDLSAICTSLRSDPDAPDVRFDSAGSQTMKHMQLMRSVGADVTNASADGFLTTTRSGHIPASHMDVLETMSAITPGMQRACWKGVPATVQTFEFEAPHGESNGGAAPMFAGAVAQNISHPHVISTFVHEVNQEERGDRTVYRLRLVQARPLPRPALPHTPHRSARTRSRPLRTSARGWHARRIRAEPRGWRRMSIGPYALQELCLGGTLAGLMEGGWLSTPTGGLHVARVMTILRHIASGMVHLHRLRLVNGDLDPSHVLLQLGDATEQQQMDASRNAPWTPLTRDAALALTSGACKVKLSNFGWTCLPTGGCIMPTGGGHGMPAPSSPRPRARDHTFSARGMLARRVSHVLRDLSLKRRVASPVHLSHDWHVFLDGRRNTLGRLQAHMRTGRPSATAQSWRARRRKCTRSAR